MEIRIVSLIKQMPNWEKLVAAYIRKNQPQKVGKLESMGY